MNCLKNSAGMNVTRAHCDLLHPLEADAGYWDLNKTAYIQHDLYIKSV